jgi:type II secretory pathway component GspD/PulD (secretin)
MISATEKKVVLMVILIGVLVCGCSKSSQDAVDIIVGKKEIRSTVLVAHGDTIFLGGLRSEESGTAKDFILLLG